MLYTDYNHKDTEKRLISQIDPGVRNLLAMLLTNPNPIQVESHDGEIADVLRFALRSVCTIPMVIVHRFENPPFWIVLQPFRSCRTIEAFLQSRKIRFSCKLIVAPVRSSHGISKPVAYHDSIVAENKLVELIYDNLRASRQGVGVFDVYHNCFGIKLNIEDDGVSTKMFSIEPQSYQMSEKEKIDNGSVNARISVLIVLTKCQFSN